MDPVIPRDVVLVIHVFVPEVIAEIVTLVVDEVCVVSMHTDGGAVVVAVAVVVVTRGTVVLTVVESCSTGVVGSTGGSVENKLWQFCVMRE